MTLRLILMRHAKSSWDDALTDDHSRVLNKRGRHSAVAVGKWLARSGFEPDFVLCSSAARTGETWALIANEMVGKPNVRYDGSLYLAAPEHMLSVLQGVQGTPSVLILGHSPGTALLAEALAAQAPQHAQFSRYPTAATTVMEFDATSWKRIGWKQGDVVDFVIPRELVKMPRR